ncbi:AMP phosphorylase [Methanosphaerula subterraneus]|uniref:AMP phosphorylase n=1 Tax=Methanosphaerula subterraneus TaxID=3350244 RepID=UPI003F840BB4
MKYIAKILDIADRGVLLNASDARTVGVLQGDRVQILNHAGGLSVPAVVDTTTTMIPSGVIGVYGLTNKALQIVDGAEVEVWEAKKPLALDLIKKKMNREKLTKDDTRQIIQDIVNDSLSQAELSAYVTACYINGLDMDEVEYLTHAMVESGDRLKFGNHPIVDKHSVGGVPGNKISLLIVPIIAASGLKIPKTSSRAITGAAGTADLMEVLAPVEFSAAEVQQMTEKVGGVIVWGGATNIAPADDRIIVVEYPFKIDARGQMLASVMAKKFAVGADLVVIDIPVGSSTKVPDMAEGRKMAREFIEIGERLGIRVECALTYGDSPVGRTIGPNLEVREALAILEGGDEPRSLIQKSLSLAGIALEMSGKAARGQGYQMAEEILKSGKALRKLRQIIEIQGGDPGVTSESIKPGQFEFVVNAQETGYIIELNNRALVSLARIAGAPHDHGAGIMLHAKKGEQVNTGDPIFTIYADRDWRLKMAVEEGRRLMPVIVEGMLLDRIPSEYRGPV